MSRPSVTSAASLRHLSRELPASQPFSYVISAVGAYVTSAVTIRHLNRAATAEMPSKGGYTGGITQRGFDLAGEICRCDLQHGLAASCAAVPRSLVFVAVYDLKDKDKKQNHKSSVVNPKESRS